jgi:hypothetical protein
VDSRPFGGTCALRDATQRNAGPQLLSVLSAWKQATEFRDAEDWIFASPVKMGRLPIS